MSRRTPRRRWRGRQDPSRRLFAAAFADASNPRCERSSSSSPPRRTTKHSPRRSPTPTPPPPPPPPRRGAVRRRRSSSNVEPRRRETTIATENDAKATAKDAQSDARDRVFGTGTLDPDESAYDVLTCDVVRTSVASVPLEDVGAAPRRGGDGDDVVSSVGDASARAAAGARSAGEDRTARAPLGRAHVRAPVRERRGRRAPVSESAVAVDSGEEETKEKKEKREEGEEEEAGGDAGDRHRTMTRRRGRRWRWSPNDDEEVG